MHSNPSTFFSKNRHTLRARIGSAPLVIAGNGLLQRTGDTTFPFAQDSSFWYLTGCDLPDAVLVITKSDEWLIVPERSVTRSAFDGSVDKSALQQQTGVQTILDSHAGWERLSRLHPKGIQYLQPSPVYSSSRELFVNPARRRLYTKLKRLFPSATFTDIRSTLAAMRVMKQPEELICLEEAIRITKETIGSITASSEFAAMRNEHELEAALSYGFRKRGASGHAFAPIVASGQHATTLHYVSNNGSITPGDLIVLDVGAEVSHYAADITRTVCQTPLTDRQRAVYEAVERVQHKALTLLKPGADYRKYEASVTRYVGEELVGLGLLDDITDTEQIRYYYPHAASHFLGLDVHDVGDYRLPLAPGAVVTCEPGIYIPEEGIGVRLEDDVLITDDGNRVL